MKEAYRAASRVTPRRMAATAKGRTSAVAGLMVRRSVGTPGQVEGSEETHGNLGCPDVALRRWRLSGACTWDPELRLRHLTRPPACNQPAIGFPGSHEPSTTHYQELSPALFNAAPKQHTTCRCSTPLLASV